MGSKHFSHSHSLVLQQLPEASRFYCSGCKSPASGNAYACWQCSYFLHEQCFHASRSCKHPSHPLHPLTLVPFPTYPSSSFFCNSCSRAGDGFSYTCSQCEFDIHVNCALTPNPNPNVSPYPIPAPNFNYQSKYAILPPHIAQTTTNIPSLPNNPFPTPPPLGYPQPIDPTPPPLGYHQPIDPTPATYVVLVNPTPTAAPESKKHSSHPHALKPIEIEKNKAKVCSACESELHGSAYICAESQHCTFSLHKACFDSPLEIRHKSHPQHPLTLLSTPPYSKKSFTCDACWKDGNAFVYNCATCGYDLHVNCARLPETVTRPDHKHALILRCAGQGPTFMCDVCMSRVHESAWVYYCRECDFGTHVECVRSEKKVQTHEDAMKEIEEMRKEMEIRNAMYKLEADQRKFMLSLWD